MCSPCRPLLDPPTQPASLRGSPLRLSVGGSTGRSSCRTDVHDVSSLSLHFCKPTTVSTNAVTCWHLCDHRLCVDARIAASLRPDEFLAWCDSQRPVQWVFRLTPGDAVSIVRGCCEPALHSAASWVEASDKRCHAPPRIRRPLMMDATHVVAHHTTVEGHGLRMVWLSLLRLLPQSRTSASWELPSRRERTDADKACPGHPVRLLLPPAVAGLFCRRLSGTLFSVGVITELASLEACRSSLVRWGVLDPVQHSWATTLRSLIPTGGCGGVTVGPVPLCQPQRRVRLSLWWHASPHRVTPNTVLPTVTVNIDWCPGVHDEDDDDTTTTAFARAHGVFAGNDFIAGRSTPPVLDTAAADDDACRRAFSSVRVFLGRPCAGGGGALCGTAELPVCSPMLQRRVHFTNLLLDAPGEYTIAATLSVATEFRPFVAPPYATLAPFRCVDPCHAG